MKILFLNAWYPYPIDNGSKLRVYHLLKALSRDHDITLLSFAFGTADPEAANTHLNFCSEIKTIAVNPFVRKARSKLNKLISWVPPGEVPVPEMVELVDSMWQGRNFDLVIASTSVMIPYALQSPNGTPLIMELHNLMTLWMQDRYKNKTDLHSRIFGWLGWNRTRLRESYRFHQFDMIILVSDNERNAALNLLFYPKPESIAVIPNGVDCTYNAPDFEPKPNGTMVYNGALTYQVNFDAMRYFLSKIFPLIKKDVPDASLTITGSHVDVNLAALDLDENVHLSGFVDDIRPIVARSSLCIVPLREGGGTRLKILEAMALGTPVISTSKGVEGLHVKAGVHLLVADGPESFAQEAVKLLKDPKLGRKLAKAARAAVEEQYDWIKIGEQFSSLVNRFSSRNAG